ncbi:glycosyltransferase family 4 protein [Psychroserpens damuponensis]|uniref:glycosyltransferase family 4 protein n=1 Tax=Psychroserpens damuponensis TaxID=943936 RepID=UPI00058E5F0A|nr:glycosyltransferase family 4 protein [Psychroserpens damuponensis]
MTKKTRILFTIPNFDTAGSQYVLLAIIDKLDKSHFDVFIGVQKSQELIPNVVPDDHKMLIDYTGSFLKDIYSLAKVLYRFKIDLVHSWDYKSNFIEPIACRLAFTPYLYTKKNAAWSKRWFLKSLLSKHIAYNHPKMKSNFFNHFLLRNKVSFIHHGINLVQFKPIESNHKDEGVFKMCCIGNIGDNKNQLFILEQLKVLPEAIHLYLFGNADPVYLIKLKDFITKEQLHNRVHLREFVENDQLPELLNGFDLFLLVSRREGLPVSILEALACGVPVLCSESGGGTQYILAEEKGGVVFNLNQPEKFKESLLKFFNNKEYFHQKKKEATLTARKFDLLKEVKAYESLYLQL